MPLKLLVALIVGSCFVICCQSRSAIKAEHKLHLKNGTKQAITEKFHYVYKVIDGDTFWVTDDQDVQIKIRLIGIDAPETRNMFKLKKHPFAKFSKAYLSDMILDKEIKLTFDVDSLDGFGRTLAYAYLKNGDFINEGMVHEGYAIISTVAPNVKFEHLFYDAQVHARENNLGIWDLRLSK